MRPVLLAIKPTHIRRDAIVIDMAQGRIWVDGEECCAPGCTTQFRIRSALLIASCVGYVSYAELFEFVWGEDEDGGPLSPMTYIAASVAAFRPTRKLLERIGLRIRSHWGRRFFIERVEATAKVAA